MDTLNTLFKTDRTMYVLDTKDLYYIDHQELFDYIGEFNINPREILNMALTIVNCRLRGVEPDLTRLLDLMNFDFTTMDMLGVSRAQIRCVVAKSINVALSILEPHFSHLYNQHQDPSTLLCIRGMRRSILLLGLYRVNSLAAVL